MTLGQDGVFQSCLFIGPKQISFETKFSNKSNTPKRVGGNIYIALGPRKEKWQFKFEEVVRIILKVIAVS